MEALRAQSSILEFSVTDPDDSKYDITFHGRSLGADLSIVERQVLLVSLGLSYPGSLPSMRFQTDISHPNISSGMPCLGGFTMSPVVKLTELVEILWDMARLAIFNPHGGYGAREMWEEHRRRIGFPVDDRILRDKAPKKETPAGSDDIELFIMEGSRSRGEAPTSRWAESAVEQFLESRGLAFGSRIYSQAEWRKTDRKVGGKAVLTVTGEGPFLEMLDGKHPEALVEWNRFVDSLGLWWDRGYAWSVHLYPMGVSGVSGSLSLEV